MRRSGAVWAVAGILVTFLALLSCQPPRQPAREPRRFVGKELRVAIFGKVSQRQLRSLAADAFECLTGAVVTFVPGTSRRHLQAMRAAKGGVPPFDIVLLDGIVQEMAARNGLLIEATPEDVPLLEELVPQARPRVKGGPAMNFFSVGILYDPAALTEAGVPEPVSWGDFWRPELQGHIAIPHIHHSAGMDFVQAAARLAGADAETLAGLKAGIDRIATLKPAIVYDAVKPVKSGIDEGTIWMLPAYNYGSFLWIGQGARLTFTHPREKGFGHMTTISVVAGTERKRLANLFLNLVLAQGYQLAQAIEMPFGPVRRDVLDPLARFPALARRFPLGQDGLARLRIPNWTAINNIRSEVEAYWAEKIPRRRK